jgi:hypothetical protein
VKAKNGMEETLRSEKVTVERKTFFLDLKENPRGRFLKITEDANGHSDSIIIPATGLNDFADALEAMIDEDEARGGQQPPNA